MYFYILEMAVFRVGCGVSAKKCTVTTREVSWLKHDPSLTQLVQDHELSPTALTIW